MKKVLSLLLVLGVCFGLTGCGESKTDNTPEKEETETTTTTYESILDDYTKKLTEATPSLVEEFKAEAQDKKDDINALAELSNTKTTELAEICNEGVEKMAELKLKNGDDDATYEDWANKLQDVYTEQAKQISDAYLSIGTGQ